jgi:hypothetical protein
MKANSNYTWNSKILSSSTIIKKAFFVVIIFLVSTCGKQSQTDAEKNTAALIGSGASWSMSTVTVGGVDQTSTYSGMTLKFAATTYTTTNGRIVWPAAGSWSFASSDGKLIKRSDGVDVTVTSISNNSLVLEFDWANTTFGGRLSSISGHHVFNFTR